MATTITKEEFETLPAALKAKFTASGEGFALIEEDVEGLKKSKAEILAEKKALEAKFDELQKFKAAHEQSQSAAEEEKLRQAGEFKQLEEKLRARLTEVEQSAQATQAQLLGNIKTERLKNILIEKGVLPDRANYALADVADQFDIESSDTGFQLKVKDGIGNPDEIDRAIEGLKAKAAFLFAANNASGSGASGSQQQSSGSSAQQWTRSQWDSASHDARAEFAKAKGVVTD